MLDSKFRDIKSMDKMHHLYSAINENLGIILDEKIFNDLLDFIDINKQYSLKYFSDARAFNKAVYNGYNIFSDTQKYLIIRDNSIVVCGVVDLSYRQNNRYLHTGNILRTYNNLAIAVTYTNSKGYYKETKQAVLERSNTISFYLERGVQNETV
jgi:hypothetical protein